MRLLIVENEQSATHLGQLTGQKPVLKMKEVWAIRTRLELFFEVGQYKLEGL